MVIAVVVGQNTHKTQLLASVYRTFLLAKLLIFVTRKGPSNTHVIDVTSLVKTYQQEKKEEAISYISSYQTFRADKNSKTYWARTKLKKSGRR